MEPTDEQIKFVCPECGVHTNTKGYRMIRIYPDNFFYSMASKDGYIMEHRLVMAKHLGRCLHKWELVHHINHNRKDNHIENLQLISDIGHRQITQLENEILRLKTKLGECEKSQQTRVERIFKEIDSMIPLLYLSIFIKAPKLINSSLAQN